MKRCFRSCHPMLALALILVLGASSPSHAVEEIKVAVITNIDSPLDLAVKKDMAEFIAAKSNGRFKVVSYPGSSLGGPDIILQSLQRGSIQLAVEATANWSTQIPELGAFDMPYVFMSKQDAQDYFNGNFGKQLMEIAEKRVKLVKFMSFDIGGFRQIQSTKYYPTLDSLKGARLRVTSSKAHIEAIRSLGMSPIPMNTSETASAMQQGVIDGGDGEVSGAYSFRYFDICKYNLNLEAIAQLYITLASSKWFNALTKEDQDMMLAAMDVFKAAFDRYLTEKQEEAFANMKAEGVTSTWWDDAEKQKAAVMGRTAWEVATPEQRVILDQIVHEFYKK